MSVEPGDDQTEWRCPTGPDRARSPALVARGFANGLGIGRLDLVFRERPDGSGRYLTGVAHSLESVTDRTPADLSWSTRSARWRRS